MNTEYNGWTNYETWRVCLEFGFTDYPREFEDYDAEMLSEYVEEVLSQDCGNSYTLSYALAFVQDCNFHEIAQAIKEHIKTDNEYQEAS